MTLVLAALGLAGCGELLNPLQKRAWDAFKDCQMAAPTAELTRISTEGTISFSARESDVQRMSECLRERHGFGSR